MIFHRPKLNTKSSQLNSIIPCLSPSISIIEVSKIGKIIICKLMNQISEVKFTFENFQNYYVEYVDVSKMWVCYFTKILLSAYYLFFCLFLCSSYALHKNLKSCVWNRLQMTQCFLRKIEEDHFSFGQIRLSLRHF